MRVFSYEQIQSLNRLELTVYDYIISHKNEVEKMTIRQLADESHVSTTTILRFCSKVGLDGFSELKYMLKRDRLNADSPQLTNILEPVNEFLGKAEDPEFTAQIQSAAKLLAEADLVLFFGIGTSGSFAAYGARLLANLGLFTLSITDPWQPKPEALVASQKVVFVGISVSGEREQVLRQARIYRELGANVISITNDSLSTLARISTVNVAYNVHQVLNGDLNLTTQVPLVFILEQIAHDTLLLQKSQPK